MGQSIADRRRKYFGTMEGAEAAKASKKQAARQRDNEAKAIRSAARRLALALSM